MADLPPRYYQKPNSLPKFILSLVTIFIMLVAIPIGVYLVGQKTNFLSQADTKPAPAIGAGETSFTVKSVQAGADPSQIAVDILVRSDNAEANLFAVRLNFPSQSLEVSSIITTAQSGQKLVASQWIESSFNNQKGEVNLIAGQPTPGIKTDPSQEYLLARVYFKVKVGGLATFHLDPDSTIFKNFDNAKMVARKNDLSVELAAPPVQCLPRPSCLDTRPACKIAEPVQGWCLTPSPTPAAKFIQFKKQTAALSLLSPQGGETVPFSSPSQIKWVADGLKEISVFLAMNGQRLGRIASPEASLNQISWRPASVLLPTFLTSTNTFRIEIEGVSPQGEKVSDQSKGPFAIVNQDIFLAASQAASLAQRGGDANHDGQVDLTDLSILLSKFGQTKNLDLGVDLNGDGVVNEVDLWLFRGVLLR